MSRETDAYIRCFGEGTMLCAIESCELWEQAGDDFIQAQSKSLHRIYSFEYGLALIESRLQEKEGRRP